MDLKPNEEAIGIFWFKLIIIETEIKEIESMTKADLYGSYI